MSLFVRDLGAASAPAVLLVHGQILDGHIFDALAAGLAARWRVLVPDLPGHGRSAPLSPFALAGVREALEEALRARGIRSVSLLGYSLGGYHALALALERRVTVERIVLLGAVAGLDAPARLQMAALADAVRAGLDIGKAFADLALPPTWAEAHPDVATVLVRRSNECSRETFVAELDAIAALPDLRPRLGELRVPVLVRVGALDRNCPPELSRELAAAIPGAALAVVPGVGHAYHLQEPEGLAAGVEAFLTGAE